MNPGVDEARQQAERAADLCAAYDDRELAKMYMALSARVAELEAALREIVAAEAAAERGMEPAFYAGLGIAVDIAAAALSVRAPGDTE